MEKEFFSLLWDREAYYKEWLQDKAARDGEYIFDLNLEYVYNEVHRWGRFGDNYDFKDIFLYSCIRSSTIEYRQRILEQLFAVPGLYEIALEAVSCISDARKKLERICSAGDELKKEIFFLQMLFEFLSRMGDVYNRLNKQVQIRPEASAAAGIRRLGEEVAGCGAEQKKERLHDYLCTLSQSTPFSIILNMDEKKACRSAVVWPEAEERLSFTDRLKAAAAVFLDDYEYSVKVYQDMDITCFDKKLQEHICRRQPGLVQDTKELYEACRGFDFWPFIQLANELVFYLSCIRFRLRYEEQGFSFTMPICRHGVDTKVEGAYDLVLGINLLQKDKGNQAVSNDFRFDEEGRIFILTGANQGGKTTFLRSVGLVQHLAQIGIFVPARAAVLGMVRHIHTHFSRDDAAAAVVGRFEQELERMRKVLECLNDGDMVLLNETFTSTRRMGAVALLCRLLREFDRRRCVGGLVTHYHEVSDTLIENGFYSLVAEMVKDGGNMGRTFKILRSASYRQSYARDIAVKCGVTYGQLIQALESVRESGGRDVLF